MEPGTSSSWSAGIYVAYVSEILSVSTLKAKILLDIQAVYGSCIMCIDVSKEVVNMAGSVCVLMVALCTAYGEFRLLLVSHHLFFLYYDFLTFCQHS
jgi:hypothetical protein